MVTYIGEAPNHDLANNPGNPSFGVEENVGDPGTADSPHSGCLPAILQFGLLVPMYQVIREGLSAPSSIA